jgi:hypothetical protein
MADKALIKILSSTANLYQTTGMNLGLSCFSLGAPTLDLGLEITKSRKFVISGIHLNYKILISNSCFNARQNDTTRKVFYMGVGAP